MGETSVHAYITEDKMPMSSINSPSSPVSSNTSSNGLVTDEITMGEVNTVFDEEEVNYDATFWKWEREKLLTFNKSSTDYSIMYIYSVK